MCTEEQCAHIGDSITEPAVFHLQKLTDWAALAGAGERCGGKK